MANEMIRGLKLDRPLCQFDLETTGPDPAKDRIVQIAILKVYPELDKNDNNITEIKSRLVNPEMEIDPKAAEIHGITQEMLSNEATFLQLAKSLFDFLKGCDLGGFNIRGFDMPLIINEFLRCGIEFPEEGTRIVDSFNIYTSKERRNLTAAYKYYCGKELVDAHDAQVDIEASHDVLLGQINMYKDLGNTVEELSKIGHKPSMIDYGRKFYRDEDGKPRWGFGKKFKDQVIAPSPEQTKYMQWVLSDTSDFSAECRMHARRIMKEVGMQ